MSTPTTKDNVAHPQPLGDRVYLDRLHEDPAAVMKHIRKLCVDREDGLRSSQLSEELSLLRAALNDRKLLSHPTWLALVQGGRIVDLLVELVQSPGFFEDLILICNAFGMLGNLAVGCRGPVEAEFFLSRCTTLFGTVWQNRELLKRAPPDELLRIAPKTFKLDDKCHPILWCIHAFVVVNNTNKKTSVGLDSYIPHVALFGWVCLGDRCASLSGMFILAKRQLSPDEELDGFIQEAILGAIGVEAVLERFEQTLEEDLMQARRIMILGIVAKLARHWSMRPFLHERETFKCLVVSLENNTSFDKQDNDELSKSMWHEWMMVYLFFSVLWEDLKAAFLRETMSGIAFRGEDAIAFLACGSKLIAQGVSRGQAEKDASLKARMKSIAQALDMLGTYAIHPNHMTIAPTFAAGISRATRALWMPTLAALRAGSRHLDSLSPEYESLGEAWAKIGALMGFENDRARKEARRFCCYWRCASGFGGLERAGTMYACKGCEGAHYCGKECQKADWAVHKQYCEIHW